MIQQLVEPVAKIDYRTLCESLIRTFGMSEPVNWDSSLPAPQQQQLFGGELLRIIADHPTIALQHDIRALCWPKGTVSQLLFLFVRLNDDRLPKSQIERITRRFVGGLEAERYTVWFFGNPSQTMLKVVLAGREGKKAVCKTLTLEAGQWYKTYDFILDTVARVNAVPAQRDMFAVSEPSVLWKAIWQAFDISIVNKNFYRDIKTAFDSLIASLSNCKGILTRPEQRAQFAVRLLGRLIFCWFLKKKGIVGSNALSSTTVKDSINFYHELLEPLFFDVFNTPQSSRKTGLPASIAGLRFLNGGLFEPQADDCQNNFQLLIPNDWFAGFFGDTLERYNFTVDENSAANSEIAIDPEMLGRIFENLLAEQNPETGASARKQTGSFYTPREIVDYMVEESLIAYLGAEYTDFVHTAELPEKQKPQVMLLLEKLTRLKTIDIAAGSGAFPIGMLQKIVMLKQVLSPKASAYDLKLETIENSIYGVDIQPMAIELSRLRCWLSLIVDEEPDKVQPLPNLDFKFVCADSLIDLGYKAFRDQCEKRHGLLFLQDFEGKMDELKKIRHDYFDSAHNHSHKQQLKQQFLSAQNEILKISLDLVKQKLMDMEFATRITGWNPFDDGKPAPFFSPDWMFGITDGFDISIGNPPYGATFSKEEKKRFLKEYKHQDYQLDSYLLFTERVFSLLTELGIVSFIIPNTWLQSVTYRKFRKYMVSHYNWEKILSLKDSVFDAVVDTLVIVFEKSVQPIPKLKSVPIFITNEREIKWSHELAWDDVPKDGDPINIVADSLSQELYKKIVASSRNLSANFDVFNGVKPFEKGKGTPPQTAQILKEKPYVCEGGAPDKSWTPLLRGRLIHRYKILWKNDYWIQYGPWLAAPRDATIFEAPQKIMVRQTGDSIIATLVGSGYIARNNLHILLPKTESSSLKYLLALLNSKLMDFAYSFMNPEKGEALAEVKKQHVEQLPFIDVPQERQLPIVTLVDKILEANKKGEDTSSYEAEIDRLIYDIYGLTVDEVAVVEGK